MSAIGPKRTSLAAPHMSAFGGKADMPFSLHSSAFDEVVRNPAFRIRSYNQTIYLLTLLVQAVLILIPQPIPLLGAELIVLNLVGLWFPIRTYYNFFYKDRDIRHRGGMKMSRFIPFGGSHLLGVVGGIALIQRSHCKVMPPLSRRGFMTSSAAAAAGYTLAAGPVRADVIRTDTNGLVSGGAQVMVPGGNMPVHYARPANAQNPPIVLVAMEIFGLHEYIKDVTRRLGHLGAFAVAPDYYFRKGVDLTKITEIPNQLPIVNVKPDTELFSDLDATVAWAKSQGGDGNRLGIMGFCRGGRTVWLYSTHNPDLKAGVAFYGSLADAHSDAMPQNALDLASQVKEPVLGLYGADDAGIKVEQVKAMEEKLKSAGKTTEFHIYPGAPHGFHADYRPSYRKEAAENGWNRMIEWFRKYKVLA